LVRGWSSEDNYQKQGIGRDLMKYAIDYSIQVGAKIAQYDTSSRNFGSKSLAKFHGFKEKKRMEVLECDVNKLKLKEWILVLEMK